MNRFPATLDATAKMVTVAVCVALLIPFITIGQHFAATHYYPVLVLPAVIVLVFVIAALWRPTAYTLDQTSLQIHRALGTKTFPLASVTSAEPFDKTGLGLGIRTFGSGGAFGYLGKFWYRNVGHITMYVTDKSKMILVKRTNGKLFVISPDDPDTFLAAFRKVKMTQ